MKTKDSLLKKNKEFSLPDGIRSPGNKRFIILYCACLFLFAAGLVLLSYLSQERTSNQMLDREVERSNQKVSSAMQTVQDLQEQNVQLFEENEILKEQIAVLERDAEVLSNETEELSARIGELEDDISAIETRHELEMTAADKRIRAHDLLWQLEKFYSWGAYTSAREVAAKMQEERLIGFLSTDGGQDGVSALSEYYRLIKLID